MQSHIFVRKYGIKMALINYNNFYFFHKWLSLSYYDM